MQEPTLTGVRVRSAHDARVVIYAAFTKRLKMTDKRLDPEERQALRSGCSYVWEGKPEQAELNCMGIERFTEGRKWHPSRVRDEFLFYNERWEGTKASPPKPVPRNWDPMVKQSYSEWVNIPPKGRRKLHLTTYFTQNTIDDLRTIDDIPMLRNLRVPDDFFENTRPSKSAKANKSTACTANHASSSISRGGDVHHRQGMTRTYAPFPSSYSAYHTPVATYTPVTSPNNVPIGPPIAGPSAATKENVIPVGPGPMHEISTAMSALAVDPAMQPCPTAYPTQHSPTTPMSPEYIQGQQYAFSGYDKIPFVPSGCFENNVQGLYSPESIVSSPPSSSYAMPPPPPPGYDTQSYSTVVAYYPSPSSQPSYTYSNRSDSGSDRSDTSSSPGSQHPPVPQLESFPNSQHADIAPVPPGGMFDKSTSSSLPYPPPPSPTRQVPDEWERYSPTGSSRLITAFEQGRRDLAPLKSLRAHPYRRDPIDDKALRLLHPRPT